MTRLILPCLLLSACSTTTLKPQAKYYLLDSLPASESNDAKRIVAYCGGSVRVIACIEVQQVIDKILSHLRKKDRLPPHPDPLPEARAPPPTSLFG